MTVRILQGDCRDVLKTLPDESVHCVVTSPPYWGLRDYGVAGQLGLEPSPQEFVAGLVEVFAHVGRVLRADGTLWLNLGDSYGHGTSAARQKGDALLGDSTAEARTMARNGLKAKDLVGIPWRVAFALQAAGWYLRQDIIWAKPNPMPESVTDRCTKSHEYLFLLAKSERYYFDNEAISEPATGWNGSTFDGERDLAVRPTTGRLPRSGNKERKPAGQRGVPGASLTDPNGGVAGSIPWEGETRNKRSVWTVTTQPFKEAHFATFPPALIEPCILAGCPEGGTVLDPFGGAGTTGLVADRLHRSAILIELNPEYADMARRRITGDSPLFAEVT